MSGREEKFDVLSVGNLLRKARKDQTELGKKASSYMDAGQLVPDDIINAIVIEGLKNAEKPIFTDGFPRTVAQATAMLASGIHPAVVVEFNVDDAVRKRLEIYQRDTYPVLAVLARANVPIFTIDNSNSDAARTQFARLLSSL